MLTEARAGVADLRAGLSGDANAYNRAACRCLLPFDDFEVMHTRSGGMPAIAHAVFAGPTESMRCHASLGGVP